ncbi:neuronal pentraxin-2-like [Lingula anatina]|uniref:Pentraxin family member n=1 Tax=Lingula anatina TaxID=7574 RepID=A0A1S3HV80_LINAN|nr:neuronal pentraxin-2-like [Lingula anatina]|eukprot:XP_013388964.1 neuronal pentraxin-2-like [Lingula anatina]
MTFSSRYPFNLNPRTGIQIPRDLEPYQGDWRAEISSGADRTTIFRWPPPQTTKSYVKLQAATPAMTAMTACLRAKTAFIGNDETFLLSYAATSTDNSFLFGYTRSGVISSLVSNSKKVTPVFGMIYDGAWHHWCFSWNSRGGKWTVYKDGMPAAAGTGFQTGNIIPADGVWIIGQDQDTVGGGFDATQAYVGDVTSINVWNTDNVDVAAVANCGDNFGGNVISWYDVSKEIHEVSSYREDLCHLK